MCIDTIGIIVPLPSLLRYMLYNLLMETQNQLYPIGTLAQKAQVNIQTIRFYERLKLLLPKERKESKRIRYYDDHSLRTLCFIRSSQEFGFQLEEIRELLKLRNLSSKSCDDAKVLASRKLASIQVKIKQLQTLEIELGQLIKECSIKENQKHCPIIKKIENRNKCSV